MSLTKHAFSTDGSIDEYVLTNKRGTRVFVTTWGARLTRFIVCDKHNKPRDVIAGFETFEKWQDSLLIDDPYFGATVGRVAGRIHPCDAVTIAGQSCTLPETQPNKVCLHGGCQGFDKKVFRATDVSADHGMPAVKMVYMSPDGEEGFPGEIELGITFSLSECDSLAITYSGLLTKGTESVLNPTNHTYWNLTGFEERTVLDHYCELSTELVMATEPTMPMVPTGQIKAVKGTALDFVSQPRKLGDCIGEFDRDTLRGYDHAYVTSPAPTDRMRKVASVWSEISGLRLTVETDQPLLILYTGNWISNKLVGKYGISYQSYAAVALETQRFVNAVNIPKYRNQVMLRPDDTFSHRVAYKLDLIEAGSK
ncbi:hypothetical protein GGI04_001165 [Coemansia thaxteri]|uniref:Aldose 1-epimerase n=1 Tax=Coemansia thaxteri TaxID=2663907 RepID=A0A9W8BIK6_9FUNG|nr:hypothetical protein H4R26_001419 [Coemansia thaxteri]KAJ2008351.1 hypothetical protein GGI04_001165 [Coemansia thaxteri]KAJ2473181.1 hypothetical protein GGI02_001044 [Coemansia sp. RSA 2322]KAJ2485945.1 hypothetical protein EV174_001406 [Coemansia sp. RSA 2320]